MLKGSKPRDSPEVQWLGYCASPAGGMGLISRQGTKILHATHHGQYQNQTKKKIVNLLVLDGVMILRVYMK